MQPPEPGPPYADQPIELREHDRLRRAGFADALADQIASAHEPGLVLALTGDWGSGKTSLLNLLEERLDSRSAALVIRFNPWLFSGTEQLMQHFFSEVGAQVEERSERLAEVGTRLKRYGALLSPLRFLPIAGPWAELAGRATEAVGDALTPEDRSLERQRAELSERLRAAGERIAVLVDDIDRLEDEEIRQVMRLVRLVGDFPNVVYVLAFDAGRVTAVLGGSLGIDEGRRYLEKIVQLSYEVPEIAEGELIGLLREGIDSALATAALSADEWRLWDLLDNVLEPLVENVRDVRRYVNVLPLAFGVIGTKVDAVDVLGLEAARLFLPSTYDALPAHAHLLTGYVPHWDDRAAMRQRLERFLQIEERHPHVVRSWVELLFPAAEADPGDSILDLDEDAKRVGHPDILRVYLEKALPAEIAPIKVVEQVADLVASGEDPDGPAAAFGEAAFMDLIRRLPDVLRERIGSDAALDGRHAEALGLVLDGIEDKVLGPGDLKALRALVSLVVDHVEPEADRCAAAAKIVDSVESVRIQLVVIEALHPRRSGERRVIDEGCAAPIQARVRDRILAQPPAELQAWRGLARVLHWVEKIDPAAMPQLRRLLEDDEVLVQFLSTQSARSSSKLIQSIPKWQKRLADLEARLGDRPDSRSANAREEARRLLAL